MINVMDFIRMNEGLTKFVAVDTKEFDENGNYFSERITLHNWHRYHSRTVDSFLVNTDTDTIELFLG